MNNTFSIKKSISFGWNTFWANPWFWVISWVIVFGLSASSSFNAPSSKGSEDRNTYSAIQNTIVSEQNEVRGVNNSKVELADPLDVTAQPITEPKKDTPMPWALIGLIVVYAVPVFAGILVWLFLTITVGQAIKMGYIHLSLDAARGNKLDYKTILSDINLKKSFKLLGLAFVYALIVFLGFLFFIIPGIYFIFKYYFATYFMVDKNVGIRESLKMSAELTKGVKFKLLGLSLVSAGVILLGLLAFFVGVVPAGIIIGLAQAHVYATLTGDIKDK